MRNNLRILIINKRHPKLSNEHNGMIKMHKSLMIQLTLHEFDPKCRPID